MVAVDRTGGFSNRVEDLFRSEGFELVLSMDCEGTNYDRNLDGNIDWLERFLSRATGAGLTTILFITPYFADALRRKGLAERLAREYRTIFGMHIHPDNLPEEIAGSCPFLRAGEEYLASYSRAQQESIILRVQDYLHERGVRPLQAFRGGCFSMNEDTADILLTRTEIRHESHNPFREQYTVRSGRLRSLPVFALDRDEELRLEFFTTERLCAMLEGAIRTRSKALAITHSYMLDPGDFHYSRDGIVDSIHERLGRLVETIAESQAT